jgi:hypothetical protein
MSRTEHFSQNDIAAMRTLGIDLAPRWKGILGRISADLNFQPNWELVSQGVWWKTGKVGAVNCTGKITQKEKETPAVLKIQGTRPATSEFDMIESFKKQNKSKMIRPPHLYAHIPWNKKYQFEAIVMEQAEGTYSIVNHPATNSELDRFFSLFADYKENCLGIPWVKRPPKTSYKETLKKWLSAIVRQARTDEYSDPRDTILAERGAEIIDLYNQPENLEFVHGHFQPGDLVGPQSDGKHILFSNLFWSWRIPLYDLVFGYHWWMLGMEHSKNLTEEKLEKERKRWLDRMFSQKAVKTRPDGEKTLKLAMLERAIPALMVDRYMMDPTKPAYEIITKATRRELKRLILELS